MEERWYLAVLVVASRIEGDSTYEPLAELQFRLLTARDHEAAYTKALSLGQTEAVSYTNDLGENVTWQFEGLHDLSAIDSPELADGTEVYSSMARQPEGLVVPKAELTVFWEEANRDSTVRDLLGE